MARIGTAYCPNCGVVEIRSTDDVTLNIGKGLATPIANIDCSKCEDTFLATVDWKSAWAFDKMGVKVIGFSRRTAPPFTEEDAAVFVELFDEFLEEFLGIVDSEEADKE